MRPRAIAFALAALLLAAGTARAGDKCSYDAKTCLDYLIKEGKTGWPGLEGEMTEHGYQVTKVVSGGPAETAGLRAGDVLTQLNGVWKDDATFQEVYMQVMKPGNTVTFTFLRGDEEKSTRVTLAAMPHDVYALTVGRHMLKHAETYPPGAKP